jgi:hypothetical protein
MEKPEMRSEISIIVVLPEENAIRIMSTPDSLAEVEPYGLLYKKENDEFILTVDPRYNLEEVVRYIMSLSKQRPSEIRFWMPSRGYLGLHATLDQMEKEQ